MKIIAVIPARYGSSRFEGKPLADLAGSPMVAWVYHRIKQSKLIAEVYVATDDDRIAAACEAHGLAYLMTSPDHVTSTERVNEVAEKIDADLYICVNGDEPLIDFTMVEAIIPSEKPSAEIYVANLTSVMTKPPEIIDPTNIKVVFSSAGRAQFMSRAPIPYPKGSLDFDYYKHIGVLIYNKAALSFFAETPRGRNEVIEDINELRFIENGVCLTMVEVNNGEGLSVDTPKDLAAIRTIVKRRGLTIR